MKSKVLRDIYIELVGRDYYADVADEFLIEAIKTACREQCFIPLEADEATVNYIDDYIKENLI